MDDFDSIAAISVVLFLSIVISCFVTNIHIEDIGKKIDSVEFKITPVKTPEQIRLEELEKQVKELTKKEN